MRLCSVYTYNISRNIVDKYRCARISSILFSSSFDD